LILPPENLIIFTLRLTRKIAQVKNLIVVTSAIFSFFFTWHTFLDLFWVAPKGDCSRTAAAVFLLTKALSAANQQHQSTKGNCSSCHGDDEPCCDHSVQIRPYCLSAARCVTSTMPQPQKKKLTKND